MLKQQKTNIYVLGIATILGILLVTPVPAADLDIWSIVMTSCKDHLDGTPVDHAPETGTQPWAFEMWFDFQDQGSLDHIDVTKPGGASPWTTIYEDYGDWEYDSWGYSTLGDLQADYWEGTYTFEFYNIGDTLLNTVTLDYTDLLEPTGPVNFTYPSTNGQTGIDINPTLTWTIDPGAGDALAMWLENTGPEYYNVPALMTTLSWGPLEYLIPAHDYDLEVSVINVKDLESGPAFPSMTVGGDEFKYGLWIEHLNQIEFTTVPEPATIALLGLGSLIFARKHINKKTIIF